MSFFHEPTVIYQDKKDRKRSKNNESEENKALKELQSILSTKRRTPCNCEAQTHDLVANCLVCGRLTCTFEGPGECFHCGTLILDKDQRKRLGKFIDVYHGHHASSSSRLD